jgi:LTXXQ motif family protein
MDDTHTTTGSGAESGAPDHDDGGEGRCAHSRRRGLKTSHLVLLSVAIAVGTALLVTGLSAADDDAAFFGNGRPGQFTLAGWRHGWHSGGHRRVAEHVCSDARDEMLEDRLAFVESFVDFTDEQEPAWQQLSAAIRAGSAKVGEACAEVEALDTSATGHLARVELIFSTGLGIVQQVRPAFEQFYAVLDDDQKAALDKLVSRHHRH